jgi:hypothetical protein
MRVWLKLVIVWLTALALPVQGLASATMTHCGPSHERMQVTQVGAGHHHGFDAGVSFHSHRAQTAAAADHPPATAHGAHQPDKFSDLGKYKCSSCASCCAGVALLSVMPRVAAPDPTATVFAATEFAIGAFATDGPDRPPRLQLA